MANVTVGNLTCAVADLSPLIDPAFTAYYRACLSGQQPESVAFDAAACAYLPTVGTWQEHDAYFNNFSSLWSLLLQLQQPLLARSIWPWALRPVLALEQAGQGPFHKGTPYYFWGMTSLLVADYEGAYLLLHRAFEEDIRTHGTTTPDTPGFFLLTLNDERVDQALAPWVRQQASAVDARLGSYRSFSARTLTLANFRSRFLSLPEMRHAVNMYCYAMARASRFLTLPPQLWEGPFPSQIAFDTIFDLCLVVDEVLAAKFTGDWRFNYLATSLSSIGSLGLSGSDLAEVNNAFDDLKPTLHALNAGTFALRSGQLVSGLGSSLGITYGCRNRGAHTLASAGLAASDYDRMVSHINNALFLAVELLY
jgi:hypothetical protein